MSAQFARVAGNRTGKASAMNHSCLVVSSRLGKFLSSTNPQNSAREDFSDHRMASVPVSAGDSCQQTKDAHEPLNASQVR
jgi:hypothetical protein